MLTDKIGIISEPFKTEVTVKYIHNALAFVKKLGGEEGYEKVFELVAEKHFVDTPPLILKDIINKQVTYVSGLLYLVFVENSREVVQLPPEDFYFMVGEVSVSMQDPWEAVIAKVFPLDIIFKEITRRTPNFTTLIDLKLLKMDKIKKSDSQYGRVMLKRKTSKKYFNQLKKFFTRDELIYILKNDCRLTQGVLYSLPGMYKSYKNRNIIELQCEVDELKKGNDTPGECIYELTYSLPTLVDSIRDFIDDNPIKKYKDSKEEFRKLENIFDKKKREVKEVIGELKLLTVQYVETIEELSKFLDDKVFSHEFDKKVKNIIAQSKGILGKEFEEIPFRYNFQKDSAKLFLMKNKKLLADMALLRYLIGLAEEDYKIFTTQVVQMNYRIRKVKEIIFDVLAEAYSRGKLRETLDYMVKDIEKKDPYTMGHSKRVKEISLMIGRRLELLEDELQQLSFEAVAHDIGKITVPSAILLSTGALSELEYQIIKSHALDTYEILKRLEMEKAEEIAINAAGHHLRLDGKGYPEKIWQIVGGKPTLHQRILAIADAIDAMNSRRVYRNKLSVKTIIEELEKNSGTQFDPELAHVAKELIENSSILEIESLYREEFSEI